MGNANLSTGFKVIRKGEREPVGIGYIFDFLIPDPRSERLLLFAHNFNTASDKNGFIDQFYVELVKYVIMGLQNISFTQKLTKKALYLKLGKWNSHMQFIHTGHGSYYLFFLLRSSQIRFPKGLFTG